MKINLNGSYEAILQTMRAMRDNGIPFITYDRFGNHVMTRGSREILLGWEIDDETDWEYIPQSCQFIVRDRDLDLIILLSTATVK